MDVSGALVVSVGYSKEGAQGGGGLGGAPPAARVRPSNAEAAKVAMEEGPMEKVHRVVVRAAAQRAAARAAEAIVT